MRGHLSRVRGVASGLPGVGGGDPRILLFSDLTFTRASEGSYQTGSSTVAWASDNVLRPENTGDGFSLYLFEESRTNLLVDPEAITLAGGWLAQNSAAFGTTNGYVAPDGVQDADGVDFATGAGSRIAKTATVALSTTYIPSCWARVVTAQTGGRVNWLPQGGTEIAGADTSLTTEWKRMHGVSGSSGAVGTSSTCRVNQISASGVAGTLALWGYQIEAGGFPTSYIRSGTARAQDKGTLASGSIPATMLSGEWWFRVRPKFASSEAAQSRMLFSFPGGGSTDGIFITSAGQIRMDTGATQRAITSGLSYSRDQTMLVRVKMGAAAELEVSGATAGNGTYSTGGTYSFTGSSGLIVGCRTDDSQPACCGIGEPFVQ